MNMMCRDDHRAVAAFVGVALVFLFFIARVLAAEHDGAVDSAPIVPSTTLEPAGRHNADAVGAAATDVAGKDLPSESGNPGIGLTPFKYRTLAGYAPVVSAFFDDDGETLTVVQFPAEHSELVVGKGLPRDVDALASLLAKKGVTFAVTHFSLEDLKGSMDKAGVGLTAVYPAMAIGTIRSPSPECLLEETTWSRCYQGQIDLSSWYQGVHSSQDLDPSLPPPKLWKWRSLSPHLHTGYGP